MIIIKCFYGNSLSYVNFFCRINNRVFKSNNGVIYFSACKNKVYKIYVFNECRIVYYTGKTFVVTFVFNKKTLMKKIVYLTDRNYSGLKIEKGELFLWHTI